MMRNRRLEAERILGDPPCTQLHVPSDDATCIIRVGIDWVGPYSDFKISSPSNNLKKRH
jgi:hypothetical protein